MSLIFSYAYLKLFFWLFLTLPVVALAYGQEKDILEQRICYVKSKGTVYSMLGAISEQSGYLFIYDSKIVDNDKIVKLKEGKRTVRQAIYDIIGNDNAELKVVGDHILIYCGDKNDVSTPKDDTLSYFTISGKLLDKHSKEPVIYGTIGVRGSSIGSITNSNGEFRLRLPDSLKCCKIYVFHLGYHAQDIDIAILANKHTVLPMEPLIMEIPEVIVQSVNPINIMLEMLDSIPTNYATKDVYLTTFYREGIKYRNKFRTLTEAVFKVFKTSPTISVSSDQVMLLKKSHIVNTEITDTLIAKISAGIDACLKLDMIKQLPNFLTPESNEDIYHYKGGKSSVIDGRLVNVVYFEQKKGIKSPFYRGEIYIDDANSALLQVNFEIHPDYVHKAADMLIVRKARSIKITPQQIKYTISYKPYDGKYYINHVRGDLFFRIKKKNQWIGNSVLHTWFEMVTCKIDTENVFRFQRADRIPTHTIFSDTKFKYDENFWDSFNFIPWEQELINNIDQISAKVEKLF